MSNLAWSRGEKLSNVHIVQWIECSQMLTKIFQVEEKILSVRHFQLPTILPLKEIFEAICPKRWRGQVSEQEVSHAGQPRPPVNGVLRFTYAFLFFFKILLKVQFTSTHCNAFIPFLFYPFVFVISVLFLFWYNWSGYAVLACFLVLAGARVQSQLHPPAKRCQKSFVSVSEVQKQREKQKQSMAIYKVGYKVGYLLLWDIRHKCLIDMTLYTNTRHISYDQGKYIYICIYSLNW